MKTSPMIVRTMLLLLLVSSAGAVAQTEEGDLWLLAKYDSDGDRAISMNEVSNKREKLFSFMDGDADGIVSFAEYRELDRKRRALLLKARFNKLDSDSDGELSNAEYSSYYGSFDRFDHDGDGLITASEMSGKAAQAQEDAPRESANTHCLLWFCVKTEL